MHQYSGRNFIKLCLLFVLIFSLVAAFSFSDNHFSSAQKIERRSDLIIADISGRVFQDYNGNGTFETTTTLTNDGFGTIGVAIDRGMAGITVSAFDPAGVASGTAATIADGTYNLVVPAVGQYRIEFTNLPAGFFPSARSTDSVSGGTTANSGSTVQFVISGTVNVNLALNYPTDYSPYNPEIVSAIYAAGDQIIGLNNSLPVLSSFPYSAGSTDATAGASQTLFDAPLVNPLDVPASQVGTTFGLAYARRTRLIYAGAYFKRHVGFGPQGPNAIYVVNRSGTGSAVNFFTVPGTATNSHDAANYPRDNGNTGWNAVGTTSLGGLAISEDETTLYAMNLENRTLYSMNSSNGAQIASQTAPTSLPLPSGTCPAADARPFAVSFYRGQLYVGLICSAQSSTTVDTFTDTNGNGIHESGDYFIDTNNNGVRNTGESYLEQTGNGVYNAGEPFTDVDGNGVYNLGDARNLRAYVYQVNPTTLTFGAAPVFQMPLIYRRGITTNTQSANGAWRPWSGIYRNASTNNTRTVYAQPMLTDIAFDNGNLILGLRDRVGDQVGNGSLSNPNDASNTTFYQPRTAGDVIRACGALNSWTVENNGRCGGTGTAPQNVAEGPGGGEFYFGDAYDIAGDFISPAVTIIGKGSNHYDTASGGIEQMPGAPDVVITNFDAIPNIANVIHDGGIRWLSNTNGSFTKAYRLYDADGNDPDFLGKAGGVGSSLLLLSDPAPIEIGNRVWNDADSDGVQDPGEMPIAGVTVRLYQGSSLVGTAVTDANGEYYFVSSTVADPNTGDNLGQVNGGILTATAYQVRLDNPLNYAPGGPVFGLSLATANQTAQAGDDDSSDSDAMFMTNPAGSPAGSFPVVSITTGGAGSNNHTFDIGFRVAASAASVVVSGRVLTASGKGIRNVLVVLNESDGSFRTTRTGSFGHYRFQNVIVGQTAFIDIYSKRFTFEVPTRTVDVDQDIADANFFANED